MKVPKKITNSIVIIIIVLEAFMKAHYYSCDTAKSLYL